MISIIIPVYRSDKTIVRCLESIERSRLTADVSVEVVIVLDGPDQATAAHVGEFLKRTSIRVSTHHQPHSGIAAARNAGIRQASREIVTFLDADDEMTPARLAFPGKVPPATIMVGHQQLADSAQRLPGLHESCQGEVSVPYLTSLLAWKETLEGLGALDESLTLGDDWDLMLRARRAGIDIQLVEEVWAIRHVGKENASHQTRTLAADYLAGIRQHIRSVREIEESDEGAFRPVSSSRA